MKSMPKRIYALFFLIAFMQIFGVIASANEKTVKIKATGIWDYELAGEVLELVNQNREEQGIEPLTMSTQLQQAAMERATELAVFFSHTRPNGKICFTALDSEYFKTSCGENINAGTSTAQKTMDGWMNSSGHRANILNGEYTQIGVGCYHNDWVFCWTQMFADGNGAIATVSGQVPVSRMVEAIPSNLDLVMFPIYEQISIEEGTEIQCQIRNDAQGSLMPLDGDAFQWSSTSPCVNVEPDGKIVAVRTGIATVTASLEGYGKLSREITVIHAAGEKATCTTPQICTACGIILEEAAGHKEGAKATCTMPQICTVCGEVLTAAIGHDYEDTVVPPTAQQEGYIKHTCRRCQNTYIDTYVPAVGAAPGGSKEQETSGDSPTQKEPFADDSTGFDSFLSSGHIWETEEAEGISDEFEDAGINLRLKKSTESMVSVIWDPIIDANAGYKIFAKSGKKYVNVGRVKAGQNSFSLKRIRGRKLRAGVSCTIKVVPLQEKAGKIRCLKAEILKTATKPKAPSSFAIKKKSITSVTMIWEKVSSVSGYEIQMSTKTKKRFIRIANLPARKTAFTEKKLKRNKKYSFRIRSYKKVDGRYYYSAWSKVRKYKCKL